MKARAHKYYILSPINHMKKWVEHNGEVICQFVGSLLRRFVATKFFFLHHVLNKGSFLLSRRSLLFQLYWSWIVRQH